ncbi:hypothetical protein GVN20_29415, partial [Runella sp. CRIBMP]|uniref:hypothetical protein n=1 Tax=Runella sp. CRIBMP TaxID=2683261 RepID=UPI001412FDAC
MVVTVGGRCDESLHLIPKTANADNDLDGGYSAGRCDESLHLIPKLQTPITTLMVVTVRDGATNRFTSFPKLQTP